MTQPVDEVVVGLRSRLGAEQVLDAADVLAARSLDTWPLVLVQRAVGREPPLRGRNPVGPA